MQNQFLYNFDSLIIFLLQKTILTLHDSEDYLFVMGEDHGVVSSYNPRTTLGNIQTMVYVSSKTSNINWYCTILQRIPHGSSSFAASSRRAEVHPLPHLTNIKIFLHCIYQRRQYRSQTDCFEIYIGQSMLNKIMSMCSTNSQACIDYASLTFVMKRSKFNTVHDMSNHNNVHSNGNQHISGHFCKASSETRSALHFSGTEWQTIFIPRF